MTKEILFFQLKKKFDGFEYETHTYDTTCKWYKTTKVGSSELKEKKLKWLREFIFYLNLASAVC